MIINRAYSTSADSFIIQYNCDVRNFISDTRLSGVYYSDLNIFTLKFAYRYDEDSNTSGVLTSTGVQYLNMRTIVNYFNYYHLGDIEKDLLKFMKIKAELKNGLKICYKEVATIKKKMPKIYNYETENNRA